MAIIWPDFLEVPPPGISEANSALEFPKSLPTWALGGTLWQHQGLGLTRSFEIWHLRGLLWQYCGLRVAIVSQDPREGLAVDQKLASWRHALAISWA